MWSTWPLFFPPMHKVMDFVMTFSYLLVFTHPILRFSPLPSFSTLADPLPPLFKLPFYLSIVCLYVCTYVRVCRRTRSWEGGVGHGARVEARGQLLGVGFLLPDRSWGPNSGHQAWQQVPLATKTSHQPLVLLSPFSLCFHVTYIPSLCFSLLPCT